MKRRVFSLVAALGLVIASLPDHPTVIASSCDECKEECASIPMEPQACREWRCPECA
jgi:hypothetical protein